MISHQSRGEGPISLVLLSFLINEGETVSGDRVSSWAAAVVVDRVYGTCPWEMCLAKKFNQPLSQSGMKYR